ncbi:hypothetical protein ACQR3P_29520 [Rhodococcus sp. IEGM1300]
MRDAHLTRQETLEAEVFPTQAAIHLTWTAKPWADRYSIYRIEGGKRVHVAHTSTMMEYYDRSAKGVLPEYEVVAERIGDISFEDQDILIVEEQHLDAQDMAIRMQSKKGDWAGHEKLGSDLQTFIGERNTPETAEGIRASVEEALLYKARFNEVEVRVIPVAMNKMSVYAFHDEAYAREDVSL